MNRLRFSLATLMGVVYLVAAGLAALRYATQLWAAAVFSSALVILLLALLGTFLGHATTRTFWRGFAIFAWAYFVFAFGPWFVGQTAPHLLSTTLLSFIYERLAPLPLRVGDKILVKWSSSWWRSTIVDVNESSYLIHYDGYASSSDEWVAPNRIKIGEPEHFMRIGHSLCGLLFGLVGGAVAGWLFGSDLKPDTERRAY